MEYENTRKPQDTFRKMEISRTALQNLEKYCEVFDWLIDYVEEAVQDKSFVFRRGIFARDIFADF